MNLFRWGGGIFWHKWREKLSILFPISPPSIYILNPRLDWQCCQTSGRAKAAITSFSSSMALWIIQDYVVIPFNPNCVSRFLKSKNSPTVEAILWAAIGDLKRMAPDVRSPTQPAPHAPVRSLMTGCLWSLLSMRRPIVSLICLSGTNIHSVHKRAVFNRSGGRGGNTCLPTDNQARTSKKEDR